MPRRVAHNDWQQTHKHSCGCKVDEILCLMSPEAAFVVNIGHVHQAKQMETQHQLVGKLPVLAAKHSSEATAFH